MKHFTFAACIILLNASLFSQEKLSSYDGEYQIRPGFTLTISTEGSDFYIVATGQPKEKLTRINDKLFKIESIDGSVDFSVKPKKNLVIVNMYNQIFHAPLMPITAKTETWQEIKLPAGALKGLEGEYQLNASAKFTVSVEDGSLFVQLTGQGKYEVYPYAENKFFYKIVEASIEFVKDNKGLVKYLLLYQNGMIIQANK